MRQKGICVSVETKKTSGAGAPCERRRMVRKVGEMGRE